MKPEPEQLRRLVSELLVVRASGHLADAQRRYPQWELPNAQLERLLGQGVGGVILLGGSAAELALRSRQLQHWASKPLLLCADVEEGVGQRFAGASWLVPPMALGRLHQHEPERALALAEAYGHCTGREARSLGLNWVLGPVCDVNNNPLNPVINVRAWGEDAASAGALAAAFVHGVQAEGVLACAKHFPGHGDTASDSHLDLPVLEHNRERLEAIELPPFRAAIAAGVAAVMTAHLLLPALDLERPATLSKAVLTGLLRQQLGFGGLIVTDALVMEAIAGRYGAGEAAVLALEAGADLVLMPADADAAIAAIEAAVASDRLDLGSLEASVARRRQALDLHALSQGAEALEPLISSLALLPAAADRRLAEELVQCSLETAGAARLQPASAAGGVNLVRLDRPLDCPFLTPQAPALALPAAAGYLNQLIDPASSWIWGSDPQAPLQLERLAAGPVLLQLFVRGNPFAGHAGEREPWAAAVSQLLAAGRLSGLAVYGSPYLWQELLPLLPPDLAAAYSPGQMPLAQSELLQALGLAMPTSSDADSEQGQSHAFTD
ncbi:MAG: glycoside hydrolase family 3 N-terminal domain-containing protein [Prochlorococcaceae cyanobacterium]